MDSQGKILHRTVLLNETIDGLNLGKESLVVDATFGGGGHSVEICRRYPGVKIIALDQDESVFAKAENKFKDQDCDITFQNANFRDLDLPDDSVDGVIFDLGLSSDQLESSGRGFTFMKDEPLLMTMKKNPGEEDLTAQEILNNWEEGSLADIIYGYGEEKQAKRIAKEIVESRGQKEIKTTFDLVKIIEQAIPAKFRKGRIHYATKTFQAIRIAVNDELNTLRIGLEKGFNALKKGGRMSVISFHSLEDRIVKNFYKDKAHTGIAKLINKKPITASVLELKSNGRARSAKLRILSRI